MKKIEIVFSYDKINIEELRECIEDNLGVQIIEINEVEEWKKKKLMKL